MPILPTSNRWIPCLAFFTQVLMPKHRRFLSPNKQSLAMQNRRKYRIFKDKTPHSKPWGIRAQQEERIGATKGAVQKHKRMPFPSFLRKREI